MAELKINSSKYGERTILYDDDDCLLITKYNWSIAFIQGLFYCSYSIRIGKKNKSIRLHRIIMNITNPKIKIDHIDGNGLNNCKSNLRIATSSQNAQNSKRTNRTGFKGVTSSYGKYFTRIYVNKKRITLGYFNSPQEGAIAYNQAAKKYFGEFARLNII